MMSHPSIAKEQRKHSHYFKDVEHLDEVDVYRVCDIFAVDDPSGATQHAIKKLLLPGQRGAGKTRRQDLKEAIDTLTRRVQMMDEDDAVAEARKNAAGAGGGATFGVDLGPGPDITSVHIIGGGLFASRQVRLDPILAAPWVNLMGHTTKPAEVLDDQLVRVKYRNTGEDIKAASEVSWRNVVAYQVFNLG